MHDSLIETYISLAFMLGLAFFPIYYIVWSVRQIYRLYWHEDCVNHKPGAHWVRMGIAGAVWLVASIVFIALPLAVAMSGHGEGSGFLYLAIYFGIISVLTWWLWKNTIHSIESADK